MPISATYCKSHKRTQRLFTEWKYQGRFSVPLSHSCLLWRIYKGYKENSPKSFLNHREGFLLLGGSHLAIPPSNSVPSGCWAPILQCVHMGYKCFRRSPFFASHLWEASNCLRKLFVSESMGSLSLPHSMQQQQELNESTDRRQATACLLSLPLPPPPFPSFMCMEQYLGFDFSSPSYPLVLSLRWESIDSLPNKECITINGQKR